MNTTQLVYFVHAAETENLTKAADILHITTPALSQMVQKLESELGVELFQRRKGRVHLTYAGRRLLDYARANIQQQEDFLREIHDIGGPLRGRISFASTPHHAVCLWPLIAEAFVKRCPQARLDFLEYHAPLAERRQRLLNHYCDFSVLRPLENDHEVEYIPICDERMYAVVGRDTPMFRRHFPDGKTPSRISLAELQNEPVILKDSFTGTYNNVMEIFRSLKAQPKVLFSVSNNAVSEAFVARGLGYTVLFQTDKSAVSRRSASLCYIPIDHPSAVQSLAVAYCHTTYLSALHRAFIDCVRERLC